MGLPSFITQMGAGELLALMTGISIGWGLCVKIRVQPLSKIADKLEERQDEWIAIMKADFLEKR